ncbi:hypothetical protein PHLGIDRAFT_305846 [Phlebiopsis gigantea 11061_1 CR5-6]|uniref:Uncharacterized protein n=1 Tax=Phlebiopsis gigantea (strain 11061_1 CR5-6) TaxID=745531 RepID=A0A0C3S017_PHLG1|nr:hypothetical protein PHLGIDRAFT_305846 [Phlebiopsis gigantea 11061_1 CR5-6]
MYPYYHSYDLPASTPRYVYSPSSAYGRPDPTYWQALAEEEAARRQYQQALREQEDARNRAARARLARQVFESPYESPSYDSYLAEDDDSSYGYGPRTGRAAYLDNPYLSPQQQRAYLRERQRSEQQRRLEALEREREKERQRIVALEEERKRRLLEEERRRRIMLEEEERQRRREEERQRREDDEYLRRQASPTFSPLDELLGFRPSRFMPPEMVRLLYIGRVCRC